MIFLNGEEVGYIQVGGYGHSLGAATGIGFAEHSEPLTVQIIETAHWQIAIAGELFDATASLKPLYDPQMTKIKC